MTDLPRLARWLGPRYVCTNGRIFDGATSYELDDDQLLGAILRRAAELYMEPYLIHRGAGGWRFSIYLVERGHSVQNAPTPLSAALAAVMELTKETT